MYAYTMEDLVLYSIIASLIIIIPTWRIFGRAGFSPAFSLLVFLGPLGAAIILLMLAFGDWPSLRKNNS